MMKQVTETREFVHNVILTLPAKIVRESGTGMNRKCTTGLTNKLVSLMSPRRVEKANGKKRADELGKQ
jgi:hypothetical protein